MTSLYQTSSCPKCGAPIYAISPWHSVSPPPNQFTCECFPSAATYNSSINVRPMIKINPEEFLTGTGNKESEVLEQIEDLRKEIFATKKLLIKLLDMFPDPIQRPQVLKG